MACACAGASGAVGLVLFGGGFAGDLFVSGATADCVVPDCGSFDGAARRVDLFDLPGAAGAGAAVHADGADEWDALAFARSEREHEPGGRAGDAAGEAASR